MHREVEVRGLPTRRNLSVSETMCHLQILVTAIGFMLTICASHVSEGVDEVFVCDVRFNM